MLKRLIPIILALFASSASAQIINPGVIVFDEASQLGRARSLAFVGSTVSCGISGGLATCTFTAPSVTLTHNSTATSGCTAGAIVRSTSNLADCSAGLTYASGALRTSKYEFGGATDYFEVVSGVIQAVASNGIIHLTGSSNGSFLIGSGSNGTAGQKVALRGYSGTLAWSDGISVTNVASGNPTVALPNGATIGSASLGSTVVPLTTRLGTGSTANLFEMQNSAGTNLAYFTAEGRLRIPTNSSTSAGAWAFDGDADSGVFYGGANNWGIMSGANINWLFQGASTFAYQNILAVDGTQEVGSATYPWRRLHLGASGAASILFTPAAATLQMGNTITSGSAINQTFRSHNATTGTDISGGNLTIVAPGGTGSSTGGTIAFQTAPVLASGTTAQTPVDRLTIPKTGGIQLVTASTKPTCDSAARGQLFYVAGGAGVADTYEVCTKDNADAYAWRTIF